MEQNGAEWRKNQGKSLTFDPAEAFPLDRDTLADILRQHQDIIRLLLAWYPLAEQLAHTVRTKPNQ